MKISFISAKGRIIIAVLSILLFQSCEDKPVPPKLTTSEASNVSVNTAFSGGNITNDGGAPITETGVCWSRIEMPTTGNDKTTESFQSTTFTSQLTDLLPKTKYFFRAYATNSSGTGYGNELQLTTLGDMPGSNALDATNIQLNSATLNASVNPNHLPTKVTFDWGISTDYGNSIEYSQNPLTGNNLITLSADLSGLAPGKTYHFRIKSENSLGITLSNDKTFKTLGDSPSVTFLTPTNIHVRNATLNGTVNPNYMSSTVTFEWGTSANLGQIVEPLQNPVTGNSSIAVNADLPGLLPGTTYYVRIKASNILGTSYSNISSFTTPEIEYTRSSEFPGTARSNPLSFVYNGKGYYGLGKNSTTGENLHDFWIYDPVNLSWTRLGDCPFTFINSTSSRCLAGSTLYVFKEWALYSYNINADTWQFLHNTTVSLFAAASFSINGKPYFYIKSSSELYEYNAADNSFSKKTSVINNYADWFLNEIFIINNEAFLLHKNDSKVEIYHYLSQTDTWEKKLERSFSNTAFSAASFIVTLDNCAFIGQSTSFQLSSFDENADVTPISASRSVWKYDPVRNEFLQCPDFPGEFRAGSGWFSFPDLGLVIGGATVDLASKRFVYLKDAWIIKR